MLRQGLGLWVDARIPVAKSCNLVLAVFANVFFGHGFYICVTEPNHGTTLEAPAAGWKKEGHLFSRLLSFVLKMMFAHLWVAVEFTFSYHNPESLSFTIFICPCSGNLD